MTNVTYDPWLVPNVFELYIILWVVNDDDDDDGFIIPYV